MGNQKEITICGEVIPYIVYRSEPVLMLKTINQLLGLNHGNMQNALQRFKHQFIEYEDFYLISPDEAENLFDVKSRSGLYLITESGYLLLIKLTNHDPSFVLTREIINRYFKYNLSSESDRPDDLIQRSKSAESELRQLRDRVRDLERQLDHEIYLRKSNERQSIAHQSNNTNQITTLLTNVSMSPTTQPTPVKPVTGKFRPYHFANIIVGDAPNKRRITAGHIAKYYGMTAQAFNSYLKDEGVQYKDSNSVWHLTRRYDNGDRTHHVSYKESECPETMYWTSYGVAFLVRFFADRGRYPIQEYLEHQKSGQDDPDDEVFL